MGKVGMQTLLNLVFITQQPCFAAEAEQFDREARTPPLWEHQATAASKTSLASEWVTSPTQPPLPHVWHISMTSITFAYIESKKITILPN